MASIDGETRGRGCGLNSSSVGVGVAFPIALVLLHLLEALLLVRAVCLFGHNIYCISFERAQGRSMADSFPLGPIHCLSWKKNYQQV
jgi:hypothetical protein